MKRAFITTPSTLLVPDEMQKEQNNRKDSNNRNHITFEQYTSNVRLTYSQKQTPDA